MVNNNQSNRSASRTLATWITLAVAVGLLLVWQLYWRPKVALEQATKHPAAGQKLPLLELQPLTGTTEGVSLEDVSGKVVLINYWGTWCGLCQHEFPGLVELWDHYRGNPDFVLLSVSCGQDGWPENIPQLREDTEQFLKSHSATVPTYVDADGASRQMFASLTGEQDIAGYPTTVLLDGNGVVRAVWDGYAPGYERRMEQMVSKLLAE